MCEHAPVFQLNGTCFHADTYYQYLLATGGQTEQKHFLFDDELSALAVRAHRPDHSFFPLLFTWWHTSIHQKNFVRPCLLRHIEKCNHFLRGYSLHSALFFFCAVSPTIVYCYLFVPNSSYMYRSFSYLTDSAPITGAALFTFCIGGLLLVAKGKNSRILRAI